MYWYVGCGVYAQIDDVNFQFVLDIPPADPLALRKFARRSVVVADMASLLARLSCEHPEIYEKNKGNEVSYRYRTMSIRDTRDRLAECKRRLGIAEHQAALARDRVDEFESQDNQLASSTILKGNPTEHALNNYPAAAAALLSIPLIEQTIADLRHKIGLLEATL